MAMKKAEMEDCCHKYNKLMAEVEKAKQAGSYHIAIKKALLSWTYVNGMMQYERRYNQREFKSVGTIDFILKFSPLLFDFKSLNKLESLIKENRQIENNTSDSIRDKLLAARSLMMEYRRLWNCLEQNIGIIQDSIYRKLKGNKAQWKAAIDHWAKMKLLHRVHEGEYYRISLSTRMGEVVNAKCPACGNIAQAPKAMLLEATSCPSCNKEVELTIIQTL